MEDFYFMLMDILATDNMASYNVKIAQVMGLHTAIYLNELMNINEKAFRKNKIEENFFTIDRNYIQERTTLDEDKQKEIETNLLKIGILEKTEANGDTISLNITILTSILMSPDEKLIKNISNLAHIKPTKSAKAKTIKNNLKAYIETTNEELQQAYGEWIDAVYSKNGWMSKKQVTAAQEVIDTFSNRNLDLALKIIEIATIHGYKDMTWAINNYKRDYNVSYHITASPQVVDDTPPSVSDEIF
jgi:hypothetical protein